jgi:primosomal protein N' (replication factor Y)
MPPPMPIARVIVDRSADREFDYTIPPLLAGVVQIGSRVRLPFGGRESALGTVVDLLAESDVAPEKLRPIDAVVGDRPIVSPLLLGLGRWMADYYCCPVEVAMRSVLPQVIRAAEVEHKKQLFVRLLRRPEAPQQAAFERKAPRQAEVLSALAAAGDQALPAADLTRQCGATHQTLQALARAGWIALTSETVARDPYDDETFIAAGRETLTGEQEIALAKVRAALAAPAAQKRPVLLHGVTGSGKTEVYLQAISLALDRAETALVLVPEISLTPQTVERFKSRFAAIQDRVAVLHSHLSSGERHDEWHKVHGGHARIVIGARSAVFAPLANLGLIVVDEEHETSYKQEEAPRYQARDVAVLRAKLEGCAIVLGSATPSIESYYNAVTGKYELATLTIRVDDRKMPRIRVVDMRREAQRQKQKPLVLSEGLRGAITERLARGEQMILFLNRRGFASSLICPACGHVSECVNCSVALTYHRAVERLICHLCGYQAAVPASCPQCHDPSIRQAGLGTERVEEVVRKVFPDANIKRMDADAMSKKDAYRETLHAFRVGKIDILVGTQMIAKGLHFPNVTLVGIINADLSLHLPDFRAGERTFQLLTQVSGRAGRGELEGEVFVQTFTPMHSAIQFARHNDFEGYYEQEISFRRQCVFPPFVHLVLITVRCPHQERGRFSAETLARRLRENLPAGAEMGEAGPAPLEKLKTYYRYQLLLRGKSALKLGKHVRAVLAKLPLPEDVSAAVDVDPYQLM